MPPLSAQERSTVHCYASKDSQSQKIIEPSEFHGDSHIKFNPNEHTEVMNFNINSKAQNVSCQLTEHSISPHFSQTTKQLNFEKNLEPQNKISISSVKEQHIFLDNTSSHWSRDGEACKIDKAMLQTELEDISKQL